MNGSLHLWLIPLLPVGGLPAQRDPGAQAAASGW